MKSRVLLAIGIILVLVVTSIGIILFIYPYETEEILTGKGSWNAGYTYDFGNQIAYANESKRGDVLLVPQGGGEVGPGILPDGILNKVNAMAIYDAGTNTSIDCRKVDFDRNLSSITLVRLGPLTLNRTVCINTEENEYARMVFPGALANFEWTLYKKKTILGYLSVVYTSLKPSIIPDEILVKCENHSDCIMVQNSCNNCGCSDGKMKAINKNYKGYWEWYLENILKGDLKCTGGCRTSVSQDRSCSGVPRCNEGKCIIDHIVSAT